MVGSGRGFGKASQARGQPVPRSEWWPAVSSEWRAGAGASLGSLEKEPGIRLQGACRAVAGPTACCSGGKASEIAGGRDEEGLP